MGWTQVVDSETHQYCDGCGVNIIPGVMTVTNVMFLRSRDTTRLDLCGQCSARVELSVSFQLKDPLTRVPKNQRDRTDRSPE